MTTTAIASSASSASASASATATASAWKVLRFPVYLLEYCSAKCNLLTFPSKDGNRQIYVPAKVSRRLRETVATLAYCEGMEFYEKIPGRRNASVRVPVSVVIDALAQYQSEGEEFRDFPRELTYGLGTQKCATCAQLVKWIDDNFTGDTPLRVYEQWDGRYMRYDIKKVGGSWKVYDGERRKEIGLDGRVSLKGCVIDTHNDPWLTPKKKEKVTVSEKGERYIKMYLERGGCEDMALFIREGLESGSITDDDLCELVYGLLEGKGEN